MLKCKNGHELAVGDRVYIPCIVTAINADQENDLTVETEEVVAPGRNKVPLAISCKQVVAGKRPDPTAGTPEEDDVPGTTKHKHK